MQPNVFLDRDDTFFGVCEAIGQDFGFNANYLRAAIGIGILASPLASITVYATLGVAVLASRLLFPAAKPAAVVPAIVYDEEPMRLAA